MIKINFDNDEIIDKITEVDIQNSGKLLKELIKKILDTVRCVKY